MIYTIKRTPGNRLSYKMVYIYISNILIMFMFFVFIVMLISNIIVKIFFLWPRNTWSGPSIKSVDWGLWTEQITCPLTTCLQEVSLSSAQCQETIFRDTIDNLYFHSVVPKWYWKSLHLSYWQLLSMGKGILLEIFTYM